MHFVNAFYLPSGRVFLLDCDGYRVECTEMRDVTVDGKSHVEVRTTQDPHIIWRHLVPYEEKWLLTVSTQKGCTFNCNFCDVAKLKFEGNLTADEILDQIELLLHYSPYVTTCKKAKIGFARMGEPACNLDNVLTVMAKLPEASASMGRYFDWLPCFNSILPKRSGKYSGADVLRQVIDFKESEYDGYLHLQISCNSTDETIRKELFGGADVLSLNEIVEIVNECDITNRTVTLNFIVMKDIPVDVRKLQDLGLNKDKFAVKLIPLNNTINANDYKLKTFANYNNYEDLLRLKSEFEQAGIPVVVDAIAKCEEAGLCCGQLAQVFA